MASPLVNEYEKEGRRTVFVLLGNRDLSAAEPLGRALLGVMGMLPETPCGDAATLIAGMSFKTGDGELSVASAGDRVYLALGAANRRLAREEATPPASSLSPDSVIDDVLRQLANPKASLSIAVGPHALKLIGDPHQVEAIAEVGVAKARNLAAEHGVSVNFAVANCDSLAWPERVYDGVAAIFHVPNSCHRHLKSLTETLPVTTPPSADSESTRALRSRPSKSART